MGVCYLFLYIALNVLSPTSKLQSISISLWIYHFQGIFAPLYGFWYLILIEIPCHLAFNSLVQVWISRVALYWGWGLLVCILRSMIILFTFSILHILLELKSVKFLHENLNKWGLTDTSWTTYHNIQLGISVPQAMNEI